MNALLSHAAARWADWAAAASWQVALLVTLVTLVALASRQLSARFRYVLWLLVLVKLFTPPSLGAGWGLGRWVVAPARQWVQAVATRQASARELNAVTFPNEAGDGDAHLMAQEVDLPSPSSIRNPQSVIRPAGEADEDVRAPRNSAFPIPHSPTAWLALAWLAGVMLFLGLILVRYALALRMLRRAVEVEEGPLRITVERLALGLGAPGAPRLLLSEHVSSPFLLGLLRPRIVLPTGLPGQLDPAELENVLLHELMHWRRRDLWVGWLQVLGQALFWFHPLVWLAGAQLRHERECACDEAVLATGRSEPRQYGRSLLQVLLAAGGRSSATLGFLGIFERNTRLQRRLEEIMTQESKKKQFGWPSRLFILLFTLACLPMAPVTPRSQPSGPAAAEATQKESRKRYFVRLVVGEGDEMTFEGGPVTFETLPGRLAAVPNRAHTVLEIAAASEQAPPDRMKLAWDKAWQLDKKYHFEYLSDVGVSPLGAKGAPPQTGFEFPERRFVRAVLGPDGKLTFQGREVTKNLEELLKTVPEREKTEFQFAIASNKIDSKAVEPVKTQVLDLAGKAGFEITSIIGVHPAGSYGIRSTTLWNGNLVRPITVDLSQSPQNEPLTVQYAVIAICQAAGIPYQWEKSAQLADPERRKFIEPLRLNKVAPEQALLDVLNPVGLRFDLDGHGLFLYRAQQDGGADKISPKSSLPSDATEESLSREAEAAIDKGDLVGAVDKEMGRVMLRARSGNPWKDKIGLDSIYQAYTVKHHPDEATLQGQFKAVQDYLGRRQDEPEYAWRINQLLSVMAFDLKRSDEAASLLDRALAAYPETKYQLPSKQSRYHHLVNERAGLIWAASGPEAAEAYMLKRLESDPKCEYFFAARWKDQYQKQNQADRFEPMMRKVYAAYKKREVNFPAQKKNIELSLNEPELKKFANAAVEDKK